jgi:hypothetical protein
VYLLYRTPTKGAEMFQTVVAYGSRAGAAGAQTSAAILAGIWKNFSSLQAKTAGGLFEDPTPTLLTYYKQWPTAISAPASTLERLLSTHDGQCGTFVDLLYNAILAQGLPLSPKKMNVSAPPKSLEMLLVGPWWFNVNAAKPNVKYPYQDVVSEIFADGFGNLYPAHSGKKYQIVPLNPLQSNVFYPGRPGGPAIAQNNTNPFATFSNHQVLLIGSTGYDPSYGRTYNSRQDLQNAITGFYVIDKNPRPDGYYLMQIRKPDPNKVEIDVNPAP